MKQVSFYRTDTGLFTGNHYQGPAGGFVLLEGQGAIEGMHDRASKRVDLETMQVVDYAPPPVDAETLAAAARAERELRLSACDWVVARAAEFGEAVPDAWRTYRKALRDVPTQQGFPQDIEWPKPPTS